jgi:hypothetical protein
MKSTPLSPSSIMRLIAFDPPPPIPTTFNTGFVAENPELLEMGLE